MCGTLILFVLFINYKDIFVFAQNLALTEAGNNPEEGFSIHIIQHTTTRQ